MLFPTPQHRADEVPTDADLARFIPGNAIAAGRAYAQAGRVLRMTVSDDGNRIEAETQGSRRNPYAETIVMRRDPQGHLRIIGLCSCAVHTNCKHVAAVLIVARGRHKLAPAPAGPRPRPPRPGNAGADRRRRRPHRARAIAARGAIALSRWRTGWRSWKPRSRPTRKTTRPASASACSTCWTRRRRPRAFPRCRCSRSRCNCARTASSPPPSAISRPRACSASSRRASCAPPTASSCAGWRAAATATTKTRTRRTPCAASSPPAAPAGAASPGWWRTRGPRAPAASPGWSARTARSIPRSRSSTPRSRSSTRRSRSSTPRLRWSTGRLRSTRARQFCCACRSHGTPSRRPACSARSTWTCPPRWPAGCSLRPRSRRSKRRGCGGNWAGGCPDWQCRRRTNCPRQRC